MEILHYRKAEDQVDPGLLHAADRPIDTTPFLGTWLNTDRHTGGIVKLILTTRDGALTVRAFGACDPAPCEWGEQTPAVFAENVGSRTAKTISVVYDFGFMETSLQAFTKLGVMVVAVFTRFKDGSGRADYFDREFFYKADADEASAS